MNSSVGVLEYWVFKSLLPQHVLQSDCAPTLPIDNVPVSVRLSSMLYD